MTITLCAETALTLYFQDRTRVHAPMGAYGQPWSFDSRALELWANAHALPLEETIHVAVPCRGKNRRTHFTPERGYHLEFHVTDAEGFDDAFLLIDGALVARPELCFLQMATRLSVLDLALLGFKMCGDYRPAEARFAAVDLPLTSVEKLRRFLDAHPRKHGIENARAAVKLMSDGSNSHMESRLALFARMPLRLGGCGVSCALLNKKVRGLNRRVDLYWPEAKLALEYDSDENHEGVASENRDALRRVQIEGRNIHVISVRKAQLESWRTIDELAAAVRTGFGRRVRKLTPAQRRQRERLVFLLFRRASSGVIDCGKD